MGSEMCIRDRLRALTSMYSTSCWTEEAATCLSQISWSLQKHFFLAVLNERDSNEVEKGELGNEVGIAKSAQWSRYSKKPFLKHLDAGWDVTHLR